MLHRPSGRPGATLPLLGIAVLIAAAPAQRATALDEAEQRARILFETRAAEARFVTERQLYGDPALDTYLQSVMDRLFPERGGTIRVRAYNNGQFNAFAVATGNVYVHTGALLRMRNEAELASVLGHEGGHILADHIYRGTRDAKALGVLGTLLSAGLVAAFGIDPALGAIVSYSSMAGFSRDFEREADRTGYDRLVAAGYDPHAAAPVFERMAAEVAARKIKQPPYFFADHPKLEERAKNFRGFTAAEASGELRREAFVAATGHARREVLEATYERRDGRALIALLADNGRAEEFAPAGAFLLGEGYRLRGEPGDPERALEQLRSSTATYPDFAPSWGALGRYYDRHGDHAQALACLERFVALAPTAREAGFARQTIERLRQESRP